MEATIEETIRHVIERINTCWQEKRYDEIGAFLAEDAVIAAPGSNQRVRGRDAYVQSYRDYDQAVTTHEFNASDPQIDVVGNVAVAVCPFSVVYEMGGETYRESGRDILMFLKSGNNWIVVWRTMQVVSSEQVDET